MIKCVASSGLRIGVADVVKKVEWIHVVEDWGLELVKDLLVEAVEVFSVVDYHLAIRCADEPLVVRLKVWEVELIDLSVDGN